ncbi:sigma-70 family RNA polymerase sigma factor [Aeoliella sp. ICT_H6.2]|uniref:Sigma-70 family RNA polymerase sigma factor n=1 Tax=Aeoliella straminimaris TaxID=2954799 RepID=A0A9X2JJP2_9BACT|nr:sigma-70 family RNA polymerase sigma factor [Aeoliella straminimaris]MCO6048161.1 sigma-70 family RNA polymerase sigma factor [Aeoliella straminimaris]
MTTDVPEAGNDDTEFVAALSASQRDLWAFIVSVVPTLADADDLLQEVNLALWSKRQEFEKGKRFLPWAIGFTVRQIRHHRTRQAKSRLWFSDEVVDLLADDWSAPDTFVEDGRRYLSHCLKKIREAERKAIEDKYGKQMTVKQMAKASGKSLSGVYKTLNQAIVSLRECVRRSQMKAER